MGNSLLATDGYKFSMAEAGWPLRRETFYYSHRKGGQQVVPLDLECYVRALLPGADRERLRVPGRARATRWARASRRPSSAGTSWSIRALPKGARFYPREPVFSVTGPSALVSWLEPLLLQLNFRIQVATQALADRRGPGEALAVLSCEEQKRHRPGDAGRGGGEAACP